MSDPFASPLLPALVACSAEEEVNWKLQYDGNCLVPPVGTDPALTPHWPLNAAGGARIPPLQEGWR